jgi:hypothetical protein
MDFDVRGYQAPPGREAPTVRHELGAVSAVGGGREQAQDGRRRPGPFSAGFRLCWPQPVTLGRHS